jgi:transketolase
VTEVDGHNCHLLENTFKEGNKQLQPRVIVAHTVKGKGVDFMENELDWHYKSPSTSELHQGIIQLDKK